MDRIIRAFPLLPGKREALHAFKDELQRRRTEADQFYGAYGVTRETWHLQQTPHGDLVIVCSEVHDAKQAAPAYAVATAPFHAWFKRQVLEICGVDPNTQPLGPDCTCVFDWQEKS